MKTRTVLSMLFLGVLTLALPGPAATKPLGELDGFAGLLDGPTPFAIGHRGAGENTTDPTKPYEETTQSVRTAFRGGMRVVEVDSQLAAGGRVVAMHDDFLADGTCVNTLTVGELRERLPAVNTIEQILQSAFPFGRPADGSTGLVIIELKPTSPRCDPQDVTEYQQVAGVVDAIRKTGMKGRVAFESFSPVLLSLAAQFAPPEIPRALTLSALQLLSEAEIEAILGVEVTPIEKKGTKLGLQWAEIGDVYRLPGYSSVEQYLATAKAQSTDPELNVNARALSVDLLFLGQVEQNSPGAGAAFVHSAHELDLSV